MNLTATDKADLERVRGNLEAFQCILNDPSRHLDSAMWAGSLSYNVEELLGIIARLTAPTFVPGYDAVYPAAIPAADVVAGYVPAGTGWPVP